MKKKVKKKEYQIYIKKTNIFRINIIKYSIRICLISENDKLKLPRSCILSCVHKGVNVSVCGEVG